VSVAIVQLRRQQELVRLRDDFVSGVSHELRTPLAQIRLFADLLESGRLATGEQRSRSIRIINEESRRLTWLVENILHFSRAQRGAGRIAPQPVEAAPLVREIVDAFAPLARERDARFEVMADEGLTMMKYGESTAPETGVKLFSTSYFTLGTSRAEMVCAGMPVAYR